MTLRSLIRVTAMAAVGALAFTSLHGQTPAPKPSTTKPSTTKSSTAKSSTAKPAPTAAKGAATPASPPVAQVGTATITRADYASRYGAMVEDFHNRTGNDIPKELQDFVRRQALEGLIRQRLLMFEAAKQGPGVSDAEAEAQLQKDAFFNPNGAFDEAKYLAFKVSNPQIWRGAIDQTKQFIGAQKLEQRLTRQLAPSESDTRARVERQLVRVNAGYLALRKADFSGAYPEPRESEVLDYYNGNKESLRVPDKAVISVVFVNQPALPDSLARVPRELRAWEDKMQARAESTLKAIRSGSSFDSAGVHGGWRQGVTVSRGATPTFWGDNPGWEEMVFKAAPKEILSKPLKGRPGRLLVRVDEATPSHLPALREVARDVRNRLRQAARLESTDRELRAYYAANRDSLVTFGVRLRYATADTTTWNVPEPKAAEVDRYYRSHLADYASYDTQKGTIVTRPLDQVRGEVVSLWKAERRFDGARAAAERLYAAWSKGRRDDATEKLLGGARERGPIPLGIPVDSTEAGALVGDSLQAGGGETGTALVPWKRGFIVYQVYERVDHYTPSFEQARGVLAARQRSSQDARDDAGAHTYFDAHRDEFRSGRRVVYRYVLIPATEAKDMTLTRPEVEAYFAAHQSDYGTAEQVRIRHILVAVRGSDPATDATAKAKAEGLLARARKNEDFAALAREFSDDPASKKDGGDLGYFGRGTMVADFDRVAFSMRPGQISDLVHTEFGYHILKCEGKEEMQIRPLAEIYTTVGFDCARAKSDSVARARADSLRAASRGPATVAAFAKRYGMDVSAMSRTLGDPYSTNAEQRRVQQAIEGTPPGQLAPSVYKVPGQQGSAVMWVDSLAAPRRLEWAEARQRALQTYRAQAGDRALAGKRAELDSMMAVGWSLDSLGTLFGGLGRMTDAPRGTAFPGTGARELSDSLLFGTERHAGVPTGQVSGWNEGGAAWFRVRVDERKPADARLVNERVERESRIALERNLYDYFEKLKKRYPVKILDADLRRIELPPPPPAQG